MTRLPVLTYATHIVVKPIPKTRVIPIQYVRQERGAFTLGEKPLLASDLEIKVNQGELKAIPKPTAIFPHEYLILFANGEVYLAAGSDPNYTKLISLMKI